MLCIVMNAKIGNSTMTAPMKTQGGTPVQNLLLMIFLNIYLLFKQRECHKNYYLYYPEILDNS